MTGQRKAVPSAVLLLLLALFSGALGREDVVLSGQGSSLAAPIYGSWSFEYQLVRNNIRLSYAPSSSGKGFTAISTFKNDFAGSDNALTDAQRMQFPDIAQFPTVSAAVVIAYNFPGLPGTLLLSRELISKIYLGEVSFWNDTELVAFQSDGDVASMLAASQEPIQLAARRESSGTTGIFTKCLSAFYPGWNDKFPSTFTVWTGPGANANVSARVNDENFHLVDQNFGVAGFIQVTPYSIGYLAFPTIARETIFTLADMVNKHGDVVSGSSPDLAAALMNPSFDEHLVTTDLIDSDQPNAWPMGGPTYILIRTGEEAKRRMTCEQQRELLLFFKWALYDEVAQLRLAYDGYSSLGHVAHDLVLEKLSGIVCPDTGVPLLANITLPQHTNKAGTITILVLGELAGLLFIACSAAYLVRDGIHEGKIPLPAMFFFIALLVGAGLNYISLGWFYMIPTHAWICRSRKWFVGLGFSMMFAAIFVRASQIRAILRLAKSSKILSSKKRQMMSIASLAGLFAAIVFVQVLLLSIWSGVDPWVPKVHDYDPLRGTFTWMCSSQNNWVWFGLQIGYFSLLLAFGWYVVYRTWDMKHLVVESKYIAVSVYNSIIIMVIVIILFATLSPTDNLVYFVGVAAIAFLTSFLLCALMIPKLLRKSDELSQSINLSSSITISTSRTRHGSSKNSVRSKRSSADKTAGSSRTHHSKADHPVRSFHSNSQDL
jgi:phosphate transport system substrate-binding protein